jgi:hypothetical protein
MSLKNLYCYKSIKINGEIYKNKYERNYYLSQCKKSIWTNCKIMAFQLNSHNQTTLFYRHIEDLIFNE